MSLITVEEKAALDIAREKLQVLRTAQRLLEDERSSIVTAIFLRFLQTGKWNVNQAKGNDSDLMRITPADHDSEKLMVQVLMETMSLGWHDNFSVFASGVFIEGRVDDGNLTLYLDLTGTLDSEKVQEGLRVLNVDFDFGEMIRSAMQEKLDNLDKQIKANLAARECLLEKMKEM